MALAQEKLTQERAPAGQDLGVSWRAVGLGGVLVVVLALWVIYAEYIVRSSRLNVSHHFPVSVVALFVTVVVLANLWKRVRGGAPGSAEESCSLCWRCVWRGLWCPRTG